MPLARAYGSWSTQVGLFFYPVSVQGQFAGYSGSNGTGCADILRVYNFNPALNEDAVLHDFQILLQTIFFA